MFEPEWIDGDERYVLYSSVVKIVLYRGVGPDDAMRWLAQLEGSDDDHHDVLARNYDGWADLEEARRKSVLWAIQRLTGAALTFAGGMEGP